MAAFRHVDVIEVRLWDRTVGALAFDPTLACYVFEYDRAWLRDGIALAPLMMPADAGSRQFAFPTLSRDTYKGLPGAIADAMPDNFGNQLIDAWMSRQGYAASQVTALDRLAYMGKRSMGALEFRPARSSARTSQAPIEMAHLVEAARRAVNGSLSSDDATNQALDRIISVGTSAGGARAKAVLGWNPTTQALLSGQFALPEGFDHWLLKFDGMGEDRALGPSQQYGRIEYAYWRMASAAGVSMAPCRLLEENGRAHFMTQRFDRQGPTKIHIQSLCAMQHMDYNLRQTHAYESLFLTAVQLGLDDAAMTQLFSRMAFNVAARNQDDHSKNFAFLLHPDSPRHWALAPAYDVTFAYDPGSYWNAQHLMSVNGRFEGIAREDLLQVAARFSIAGAQHVLEAVNDALAQWPQHAAEAGVGTVEAKRIGALHLRL